MHSVQKLAFRPEHRPEVIHGPETFLAKSLGHVLSWKGAIPTPARHCWSRSFRMLEFSSRCASGTVHCARCTFVRAGIRQMP
ncbi:hypothetical protein [Polaromonas sp. CG9_12]|nr:hypothetical protein [Polaromonas sp. CG9_12]